MSDIKQQNTAFRVLLAISVAHLLNDAVQSVIPAIYPILKEEFALTFTQIGLITFVFQMTSSILQPFVGRYADRHPSPFALSVGMCISLVGIVLLAFVANFGMMVLSVSVIGMGSSIFHPEASRVAQMAAGERKGLAQSIFQVGGNGGSAVGPLLAALIILPNGIRAAAWFAVALVAGAFVVIKVGFWYRRIVASHMAAEVRRRVSVLDLSPRQVRNAMIVLVVLTFSKQFYLASMSSYFTFFLMDKFGISVRDSQLCLFAFLAASAIGIIAGGWIGDRIGRKYVIWCSILGAAPFALMLPYAGLVMTIVLAVVIGLVISSAFSAILVFATELKPAHVGTIAGLFFGLSFGLGGIGAAFFGWLAEKTSIEFVFQVSTLLPLLGIVAAFLPDMRKVDRGN
ncbi:MAG: MFS transporter [Muribaculaceae bacterium]|nr:MFS transporter [Muribaculaceae bacterium]